ncbi:Bacteriocin-like peptide I BlpI [Streptococcus constellatus]|nr:Bacteriocin-like peptide I BlpI [Streptococcus constellatus]
MDNTFFKEMQLDELEKVVGGKNNLGSAIGACAGALIFAYAAGPVTGGAATMLCVGNGLLNYIT